MAKFKLWNESTGAVGTAEVTIVKADVKIASMIRVKAATGNLWVTKVTLNNGEERVVAVPEGEFNDRLNNDIAHAPDPGMFAEMQQASSHVGPAEDIVPDEGEPEAVADCPRPFP